MASEFTTTRLIEFADTDMAGIAHFSRFFFFMEQAEHAFFRALGLSIHMERDGELVTWPRASTSCDYANPVRFEEELIVKLLFLMQAPATQFVRTLNEVPAKFVRTLAAIAQSKE